MDQNEMDRSEELLRLLERPIVKYMRPKSWRKQRWSRDVYRGDRTQLWFVTYSGELPAYEPFTRVDIDALLARGLIASSYPNDERCKDDVFYAISTNPQPK